MTLHAIVESNMMSVVSALFTQYLLLINWEDIGGAGGIDVGTAAKAA
jgi:hypothetical protein